MTSRRADGPGSASLVDQLTSSLLGSNAGAAWTMVETVLREGMTAGTILIELLGPVARRLGEMWETDACDFVQVTIGLHRLRLAMNGLLPDCGPGSQPATGFRILLVPAPGEAHLIGLDVAERFFRNEGWEAERADAENLVAALARRWFDVIGFSVSCHRFVGALRHATAAARQASRNRSIRILVGGPIVSDDPSFAAAVGADSAAADAPGAVALARKLLEKCAYV